jgi:hypothetical protein
MSKKTTRKKSTHQPPLALLAIGRAVISQDYDPDGFLRRVADADAVVARALAQPNLEGLTPEGYDLLVETVAKQFGKDKGLAAVLEWAQQPDDDDLILWELLKPYVSAAFTVGLSLGHRLTVPGGVR